MHHKLKGGMMQFRVEMTKNEFMYILKSKRGTSHNIHFGIDSGPVFKADRQAILVFDTESEGFTDNNNGVRSLFGVVNDGKNSLRMVLTLYPKYGVKGIVTMKPVQASKSRQK